MVDLSPYFQNRPADKPSTVAPARSEQETAGACQHAANRVYSACLADEDRRSRTRPPVRLDPEMMSLKCGRALWFGLNGIRPRSAYGCLARALERGRLARRIVVRDLRRAGYRVDWTGSLECGYIYGLTRRPHLLEVQPVPDTVFQRLEKFGLGSAIDLEIVVQCRMGFARMDRALFVAENKSTQELHFERVQFDPEIFNQVRARVGEVMDFSATPDGTYDEDCAHCCFRASCREALAAKKAG
ncbi:hypothetical protein C4J81_12755 [Deltaproteobacteria bacterium Smac51]|nr:hypothetical protein C4J81_12755 [Deltaproteobacteria bacterium Smac51]